MNFGGFTSEGSSCGGGKKMVVDGFCSYNLMSTGAMSQPVQMPKMENLGEMGMLGEGYDSGLIGRKREEELESRSGSDNFEAGSGDDENTTQNKSSKRKKYHRHTAFQIQELEAAFKDNPHPDEKARLELGKRLGLEGRQVKFWFQNRRTQMKTQLERHENSILKQENDKLRIENIAMKDAMRNPICENCGSPAILGEVPIEQHHLMIENARLKDELSRLDILARKFFKSNGAMTQMMCNSKLDLSVGRNGFCNLNSMDPPLPLGLDFGNRMSNTFPVMPPNGPAMSMMSYNAPFDKSVFLDLALAAMDELIKLAQLDSPLWSRSPEGIGESLNLEEYAKIFSPCIGVKPSHFVSEATRATGIVVINSMALMETLMDVKQWIEMSPWNIGSASTLDVVSPGMPGSRNGALQLMQAEFQILSPTVPVRRVKFVRFCKQHGENLWAVVDVSVDSLFHGITGNMSVDCRRLPSGCIVQDMPDGYSKVTWIEHTEYDETIIHPLYQPLLSSGMAFGARKWVADLQRHCELLAVTMSSMASSGGHTALPPSGKKSIVKLAQRMTRSFCTGICSTVRRWEVIQNVDNNTNTKVMMRKSIGNSGEPPGVILNATTAVRMPVSPRHLFSYLQNEKTRSHWDVLSQDVPMQPMLRIPKSEDPGNYISLLRASVPPSNANQSNVLMLQETCADASASLIVNAAADATAVNMVMSGGDSSSVPILPSGFVIMPDCSPDSSGQNSCNEGQYGGGSSRSLLTIGFQILVNNLPEAQLTQESIDTVKALIASTVDRIKTGLQCN